MHIVLYLLIVAVINTALGLTLMWTVGLTGPANTLFTVWCIGFGMLAVQIGLKRGWVK